MDRNSDGSCLICQCSCYRLSDPPCGIGTELVTFLIVKLLNTLYKPQITFLNKIQKAHASTCISLCYTYHKTQICLYKPVLCNLIAFSLTFCKSQFFLCCKKRNCTNLFQIHSDRIFSTYSFKKINGIYIYLFILFFLQFFIGRLQIIIIKVECQWYLVLTYLKNINLIILKILIYHIHLISI